MSKQILKFPAGFLWGSATSAYQIEGGNTNDWSEWEKSEVRSQKLEAEGKNPDDYICGQACKSYELFREDIKCLQELNCSAYRLGIEWSRVEPEAGKFDKSAIAHYRLILKTLKENKIKIVLTLWHWTNPVWLIKQGGWENQKVRQHFSRYARLIVNELGDLVDFWVTLNEPLMIIGHGYLDGKFPPNKKFSLTLFKVFNNFAAVHTESYKIIHSKYPDAQVSIAMTTGAFTPANIYNPLEILIVKLANYFRNDWFLNWIKGYFDYIGVNYYHHDRLSWHPPFRKNLNEKITDLGWEIYPAGLGQVLKNYQKYQKPIYILENGIADTADKLRPDFIKDHLFYAHKAIREGVDIRGYFYWSLLDNFEWAEGYWPKFGLYAVDRKTFKRAARPSAKVYAQICKNNQVEVD